MRSWFRAAAVCVGLLLLVCTAASAAPVTLQWDANTDPDISGYVVVYGTQSHIYATRLDVGNTTTTTLSLAPGTYYIAVAAYSPEGTSDFSNEVIATIGGSVPEIAIDTPAPGGTLTSAFEVGGWAADIGALSGTGVDAVQFFVFPTDGAAPGVLIGKGSYGWPRADVGSILGAQFTNVGYHFTITGLGPGAYELGVYAHSTVSGTYSIVAMQHFTVSATALMSIDIPSAESTVATNALWVSGWAIDRSVASTTISGTGVDALHVYAFPNPGSGQAAIFLGVATQGVARSDVAAIYGARYATAGYALSVSPTLLAPGVYNIAVVAHSAVSGTFNNVAVMRVTLQ